MGLQIAQRRTHILHTLGFGVGIDVEVFGALGQPALGSALLRGHTHKWTYVYEGVTMRTLKGRSRLHRDVQGTGRSLKFSPWVWALGFGAQITQFRLLHVLWSCMPCLSSCRHTITRGY